MPARAKPAAAKQAAQDDAHAVLARSAQGASILISLQVGSRALTFVVNQLLIRFLSPELLGISARFELFNISVLTFCRESIRIALGRQGSFTPSEHTSKETRAVERYEPARRAQGAINLSYCAVALGPPFALLFTWFLFWRQPDLTAAAVPHYYNAQKIYVVATLIELLAEPCFAIAAQQNIYKLRATAETSAAVARAVVSCGLAAASRHYQLGLGALPFAAGQISFAVAMNAVYYGGVVPRASAGGYAARLKAVPFPTAEYAAGYVRRSALQLAQNLYAQSGLKFFLTQGDSYIMASLASVSTLGVYSLATNYGALLARMLFQPIEESSRGVFGGLLAHHTNKQLAGAAMADSKKSSGSNQTQKSASLASEDPKLVSARDYLVTVLRLYGLLSIGLINLLPAFAKLLLSIVAGSRWTQTEAPRVLAIYAYYLPLLAFNGILEAFVAATASPAQLRIQNGAMLGFTLGFLGVAYVVVGLADQGAVGVVAANAVNMSMRILWSYRYVHQWFQDRQCPLRIADFAPPLSLATAGVATAATLSWMDGSGHLDRRALGMIALGGAYGLSVLFVERSFLADCYRLLRPPRQPAASKPHEKRS